MENKKIHKLYVETITHFKIMGVGCQKNEQQTNIQDGTGFQIK